MKSSDNLASRHKKFTYHRQYYSEVNISLKWDVCVCVCVGGGGVNILWYNILTPPPLKNIQEQYLYMETSDNLASTHKTFTYHRQYLSMVVISFLWDGGGSIYYGIIYWPPPPQWYIGMTTSKQNPMTALLYHFDHLQGFVDTISM